MCDWFANLSTLKMLAVTFGALAVLGAIFSPNKPAATPAEPIAAARHRAEAAAWKFAAAAVKSHCLAPRLAKVGGMDTTGSGVSITAGSATLAWGYVDDYTPRGTPARWEWEAVMIGVDDQWDIEAMRIGRRGFKRGAQGLEEQ